MTQPKTEFPSSPKPELGKHGFDGACAPHRTSVRSNETFSLSVFKWEATKNGKGLKKGRTIVRIIGTGYSPLPAYKRAIAVIDQLDAGTYNDPRKVIR